MEIRILGPLEVERDGQPIDVRGSKRRAVLAMLVLHANEVVRTDRLIEDLWGDNVPRMPTRRSRTTSSACARTSAGTCS